MLRAKSSTADGFLVVWAAARPAYSINETLTWAIIAQKGNPFIMRTYRRKRGSDTWHFCRNCTEWPTSGYDEQTTRPTTGELCNQCRSKEANGNCSK